MSFGTSARAGGGRRTPDRRPIRRDGGTVTTLTPTVGGNACRIQVPAVQNGGLVMYYHGSSGTQDSYVDSLHLAITTELNARGWVVAASYAAGNNWGNAAGLAAHQALYDYVIAAYRIAKIVHWGVSMGGLAALSLVANQTVRADGLMLVYPVIDLAHMQANSYLQSGINDAYVANNGNFATKSAGYDPMQRTTSLYLGIPMRFYASAADTIVPKTNHTDAFRTKIAATTAEYGLQVCTGDHGDTSHFQTQDAADFVTRCWR